MPKRLLLAVVAALGLLVGAGPAAPVLAADPVLTILFTGNTYGNVAPCPS